MDISAAALPPAEIAAPVLSQPALAQRAARRRSIGITALSTLVFAVVVVVALGLSPGWPVVRATFFDWEMARRSLPEVLEGLWVNLQALLYTAPLALLLGLVIALLRTLPGPVWAPVRWLCIAYTDLFRGMPVYVTLLIIGFGLPGLRIPGIPIDALPLGVLALTLAYSAYVSEVIRAGINSVDRSHIEAATLDGASRLQAMRHVVLPQAFRTQHPVLLNDFVALQKDAGLISVLGAVDAIAEARMIVAQTFNFTPYLVAGGVFVALSIPSGRFADYVAQRAERPAATPTRWGRAGRAWRRRPAADAQPAPA